MGFVLIILFIFIAYYLASKNDRNPILWIVLTFLSGGLALIILAYMGRSYAKYPTFDQYIAANPTLKTNNGIKCNKCGASSIRNWGLSSVDDRNRAHSCNHCGTTLFVTRQ